MRDGLLKNTLTLLGGSVPAQLIPLLAYPLLLYFYTPSDFGVYGYFFSATVTLGMVANIGYDIALQLVESKQQSFSLYSTAVIVSGLFSALCYLPIFGLSGWLANALEAPILGFWLFILPASIWLEAQVHSLSQLLSKYERYKGITLAILMQAVLSTTVSVSWGLIMGTAHGLFAGLVVGLFFKALFMLIILMRYMRLSGQGFVWYGLFQEARSHLRISLYSFGSSWLNLLSRNSVIPLLNVLFGVQVGGYFNLSAQLLQLPNRFLIGTLSQVYFQRIAKVRDQGAAAVRDETKRALLILLVGSALPCIVLSMVGPELLAFLFKEKWLTSGVYLKHLIAWSIVAAMVAPLTDIFFVKGKEKGYFWYNLVMLAARVLALVLGGIYLSAEQTISLFGWVAFITSAIMLLWIIRMNGIWTFKNRMNG